MSNPYTEATNPYENDKRIINPDVKPNMVSHPRHYNREGAMECIDEMELIYGPEALMWFCLLSAHKYRYRSGFKNNGYQDIEKSDWYMQKYKELKEKKCTMTIEATDNIPAGIPHNPAPWTITPNWIYNPTITTTAQPEVRL